MIDEDLSTPPVTRVEVLIPHPVYAEARRRALGEYEKIAHVARDTLYSAAEWAGNEPAAGEVFNLSWRSADARSTRRDDTARVRFMGASEAVRYSVDTVRRAGYSMALALTCGLDFYGRSGYVPSGAMWRTLLGESNVNKIIKRVRAIYDEGKPDDATEDPQH